MSDLYLSGSALFFSCYKDFTPHDIDLISIVEPDDVLLHLQMHARLFPYKGIEIFLWKRTTKDEYLEFLSIKKNQDIQLKGSFMSFLTPEFLKEIGFTIEDLKQLDFIIELLDDKHKYERLIYNYYIYNNDFYLTDDQRLTAYTEYKKERNLL